MITSRMNTLVARFMREKFVQLTQTRNIAAILAVTFVFCSLPIAAQFDTAQINGTVRDENGALVPNATIEARNVETGFVRETVTNSTGTYVMTQIPPGTYGITAKASGFASQERSGIILGVSQNPTIDFSLKPGATSETITVSASEVNVNTATTSVGASLETKSVNNLPLAGRNYSSLFVLQPGVTPINNDQTGGRTNAVGTAIYPSIQGQNNRSNVFLLDGINNNEAISGSQTITPVPDDIQEVKVISHTDSAQFGEGLGGTVNVITKSGTNQFHGAAWEYWRGSRFFDAKSVPSGVLQDLHQNQFGANIGGPVLLPHYNGKNRTFFFGSYEGFRQEVGSVTLQLVPVATQYNGDFSGLLTEGIQLYNPYSPTRAPFTGNQIPSDLINQNMVTFAKTLWPAPTGSYEGGRYNYENTTPNTHDSDQYDVRVDEYLSKKDTVWAHFLHQNDPTNHYAGLPNFSSPSIYKGYNFGAEWVHMFGPNSVLTVAIGQNQGEIDPKTVYGGDTKSLVSGAGFDNGFACSYKFGLSGGCQVPQIGVGAYGGAGESNGSPNVNSAVWEYKADYVLTHGRHAIYAGFNIDTNNQGKATSSESGESFSPFQTSNGSTGGNELASFILGLPNSASKIDTQNTQNGGYVNGFYGQDQWKIRDNLTLNVGLRYDISIIPVVSNSKLGKYYDIFDFDNGTAIIQNKPPACSPTQFAPCLPGGTLPDHVVVSNTPGKLFSSDWTDIQPRVGISYAFHPGTVLHVAWGRTYDNWAAVEQTAQNVDGWLMQTASQVSNLNTTPGLTPETTTTAENPLAGFTGTYPKPTPFGSVAWNTRPQFRNAYSDQWTVGVQQSLKSVGVWTINYVGSAGRHIDYCPVANTATTPGPGPVAPRTPFSYMGQSFYDQPIGTLNYNSLQTSLQGRTASAGLTYLISYTWAKGMDTGTDGWYGIGTTSIENPYDMKRDHSVTGFDLPQVFTVGWTWAVPVGAGHFSTGNKVTDYALGNWQLNGIVELESGRPFTIEDSGDIANTGNFNWTGAGYERPNLIGKPKLSNPRPEKWFNTAAFAAPEQYTFGSLGRNTMRTEPYKNLDISVMREFPTWESMKFQFRLDAFNAFNHPVWGTPNNCQNCQNFGVVNSTVNSARQLQLSGKIVF